MLICENNLPIKRHNFIGPKFIGNFSQEVLQIYDQWEGEGRYERMLLDSIIVCIVYLTSVLGSFKRSRVRIATMGRVDG
jgi:hypothetical protein